jgi:hypothetical protein
MTATAETANVAALRRIAVAGSASASTTAPSAGPATTAPCPIAARSALARCSSSSATSRAVLAATEGEVTVLAAVASAASTGASTIGSPAAATSARPAMSTMRAPSAHTISPRRSYRSARTPPTGPSTTTGRTRAAVVSATHVAEPVRPKMRASRATL